MMLHHPARRPAGAAGVDETGEVVTRHRAPARLRVLDMRLAAGDEADPVVDRDVALLADAQTFHAADDAGVVPNHRRHPPPRALVRRPPRRPGAPVAPAL